MHWALNKCNKDKLKTSFNLISYTGYLVLNISKFPFYRYVKKVGTHYKIMDHFPVAPQVRCQCLKQRMSKMKEEALKNGTAVKR